MSSHTFKVGSMEQGLTSPHQRCDGKRPCTTCVNGERGAGCTYEPWQPSRRASTKLPSISHNSASGSPSICILPPRVSANGCSFPESPTRPPSDIPLLTRSNSSLPTALSRCGRSPTPTPQYLSELAPLPTVSSFTVLPSVHFRIIPRPLRVPLLLIPPERVQISSTARSDLDMILYVPFLFLYIGPWGLTLIC